MKRPCTATHTISLILSISTKVPIDRFECPIVQTSGLSNSLSLLVGPGRRRKGD